MEQINTLSTKNTLQQNIEVVKNYIDKLLSFKLNKAKKNTQDNVDNVLKNKESSFFDGLKNLF